MGRLRSLEKMTPKKAIFSTVLSKIVDIYIPTRTLRSSKETTLKVPLESGIFQESASNALKSLPSEARNSVVFSDFKPKVRKYLINRTNARLIS